MTDVPLVESRQGSVVSAKESVFGDGSAVSITGMKEPDDVVKEEAEENSVAKFRREMNALKERNPVLFYILSPCLYFRLFVLQHKNMITIVTIIVLLVAWVAYVIAACVMSPLPHGLSSAVLTGIVIAGFGWEVFAKSAPNAIHACGAPARFAGRHSWVSWVFALLALACFVLWVALDTAHDPRKLSALLGLFVMFIIGVFTSSHPGSIAWRTVLWGFGLSFVFGLLVLRTEPGNWVFDFISDQFSRFLAFAQEGAAFVFAPYNDCFAFTVPPTTIFFAAIVRVLFYIGLMQYVIGKMAWLMSVSVKSTGPESLVAAANMFIGMSEAPLLIRPLVGVLTDSELLSVMTSGFGSIDGSTLAAFILMGVDPVHLMTACVISAPASVACAKLALPEMETPVDSGSLKIEEDQDPPQNIIHALAVGTSEAIDLVANMLATLISFVSVIAFLDAVVTWAGEGVGVEGLTATRVLGWFFFPACWLMGLPNYDCGLGGELVGIRLFVNEFVAYEDLMGLQRLRLEGEMLGLDKFVDGQAQWLDARSEEIVTYALAGFANFGSAGMYIGVFRGICPEVTSRVAKLVLRSLFAANLSCLIRGCIAGMLI